MAYPEWVEKQRKPGTSIHCIRGKYYLYEVKSEWSKEKGRAQAKAGKYLGRITEDGLLPPKDKKPPMAATIATREYGASSVLYSIGSDILEHLKESFPEDANTVFALAVLRVIEKCPFKRAEFLYERSYLSEIFGAMALSPAKLTAFLQSFGIKREQHVGFMKEYLTDSKYILFDGTNIISDSQEMDINRIGYNSHRQYDPQVNLMYAFSTDAHRPGYYRILPGNIRDVSAFRKSVEELGLSNTVIIADKGFGSEQNFDLLENSGLKYIIPLRRNNGHCNREKLKSGDKADFDGYFLFNGRVIWYYTYLQDGKRYLMFLDETLKAKEERDYLQNLESGKENFSDEEFMDKQYRFGTIAFRSNLSDSPKEIYRLYKTRGEIEQTFDFLKNLLDQDHTYLQDRFAVESWAFINHISLMLVYEIYSRLKAANILDKYSVYDFIIHLKYIQCIKINSSWVPGEISGKTQKLLDALDIHIA